MMQSASHSPVFGVSTGLTAALGQVPFSIPPLSREPGSDSVSLQMETNQELHKGTGWKKQGESRL